jgi:hypothetical protein
MTYRYDAQVTREASRVPCFPQPLIRSAHPDCELCCWSWSPSITGSKTEPWVVKVCNRFCRHSRQLSEACE